MKSACLGCGPRARQHALAYELVTKGQLSAICDLDEGRLQAFGEEFGIDRRYTDLHHMLEVEKPGLLHIVTLPTIRVDLMAAAAEHEVPVVIVEKPIAIQGEDYSQIKAAAVIRPTRMVGRVTMCSRSGCSAFNISPMSV